MRKYKQNRVVSIMVVMVTMVAMFMVAGCASMGATNTTSTNIGVTAYETAGATLTSAYNTEKAMLKAGIITLAQDSSFQTGVYAKAVTCYRGIGTAAIMVLTATDSNSKVTAQAKFDALNAQLPTLIADVTKFLTEVKR